MKYIAQVHGSAEQARPIVVGKTTVYRHENIAKVTTPDPMTGEIPEDEYTYDEWQYTYAEWLRYISEQEAELESATSDSEDAILEISEMASDMMDAILELSELVGV